MTTTAAEAPAPVDGVPAGSPTVPSRVLAPGTSVRTVVAPLVFGAVVIGLWQVLVTALDIDPYVVPAPSAILAEVVDNLGSVTSGAVHTGLNALLGLVIGTLVAVVAAVLASVVRVLDALAAPVVAALSVMPIVALAPVLYTLYGASVETARVLVAALAVLIPVYVNTLRGLRQTKAVHRDLMRAYAATPAQQQWALTLPTAAPYLFTGLRIASSLAVISALVAEYFGGPIGGLGKSITSAASSSNYPLAWAYVLGAIVLGLVFYCVALAVERLATRHR
ncbi:NitT/TauT family transport system permease protein [Microlunatus sagamiharensis]|uniref:NitT/TauT family transport system permease protein n=1 Tax=Microlunatus sagamiharensis TaxID=546874 RepID=A0A1H2NC57_9ACTN|nr:ABC transporter permease subunit [Microlunatus sagamiharensis]SDV03047.1 NitT/TauT family transport system permease protein [Microlunatus sagamiharensis]